MLSRQSSVGGNMDAASTLLARAVETYEEKLAKRERVLLSFREVFFFSAGIGFSFVFSFTRDCGVEDHGGVRIDLLVHEPGGMQHEDGAHEPLVERVLDPRPPSLGVDEHVQERPGRA